MKTNVMRLPCTVTVALLASCGGSSPATPARSQPAAVGTPAPSGTSTGAHSGEGGRWQRVGGELRSAEGYAKNPTFGACGDHLYLLYSDYTFENDENWVKTTYHDVYLARLEGAEWRRVGGDTPIFHSVAGKKVAEPIAYGETHVGFDESCTPHVIAGDNIGGGGTIKKLTADGWTTMAERLFMEPKIKTPDRGFPFLLDGELYVVAQAGIPFKSRPFVNLYRIDGKKAKKLAHWKNPKMAGYLYMDVEVIDGVPHVAFSNRMKDGKVVVFRYADGAWQRLGDFASSVNVRDVSLSSRGGEPYVAFSGVDNLAHVNVWRAGGWQPVGAGGFSPGPTEKGMETIRLAFAGDSPVVVFRDNDLELHGTAMKLDDSQWSLLGPRGFTGANALEADLFEWRGALYYATNVYSGKQIEKLVVYTYR